MKLRHLIFVVQFLFGVLWLWTGLLKLKDPIAFSDAIRNYRLIGDPLIAAAALALPWLEIVCGVCLMGNWLARGSLSLLWGSLLVFTAAIALAWARGLDIACGCFGFSEDSVNYPIKLAQNFALLLLGGWLWREAVRRARSNNESVAIQAS